MRFFRSLRSLAAGLALGALALAAPAHAGQVNLPSNRVIQTTTEVHLTELTANTVVVSVADGTRFTLFNVELTNPFSQAIQITLRFVLDSSTSVSTTVDVPNGTHTYQLPYAFAGLSLGAHTIDAYITQNVTRQINYTTETYLGVFSPNEAGIAFSIGAAPTADALTNDPTDCGANTFANATDTQANLSCTSIPNAATTATNANTASAIVARDGSGNFSAGTVTANLTGNVTGNASTATALAANGSNCNAGDAPRGTGTAGDAENCTTYVQPARAINTTAPVTGGGDLSADRTIAVSTFVAAGGSHARGVVPDPGASAHTPPWILRDDATFGPQLSGIIGGFGTNTGAGMSNTTTTFAPLYGAGSPTTTETENTSPTPLAGTIKNLYCNFAVAPGAAKSWTMTLRKNTASTSLTCQVAGAGTTTCNDTTHTFTVVAGDLLDLQVVPAGTPTTSGIRCSIAIDPS